MLCALNYGEWLLNAKTVETELSCLKGAWDLVSECFLSLLLSNAWIIFEGMACIVKLYNNHKKASFLKRRLPKLLRYIICNVNLSWIPGSNRPCLLEGPSLPWMPNKSHRFYSRSSHPLCCQQTRTASAGMTCAQEMMGKETRLIHLGLQDASSTCTMMPLHLVVHLFSVLGQRHEESL